MMPVLLSRDRHAEILKNSLPSLIATPHLSQSPASMRSSDLRRMLSRANLDR
jgi:hypothetical protein